MSQKIKTSVEIDGSLKASQIANATTDTDKFLVSDDGTIKYRTGAEMLSDLGVSLGTASKIQHQVKAGVAINKGQAVYVTSADGTNMIVGLASNVAESSSSKTMGLLNATVSANGFADVIAEGLLSGLDTSTATVGNPVWLGTNGNLIYGLANKPSAPSHLVFIGIVTRVNANNGEIFVKVQNGFELDELHDVDLKSTTPSGNDILAYEGAPVNLWKNKSIAAVLGYTPYNASNPAGYISTYTETDTLASVTSRGATTSTLSTFDGGLNIGNTKLRWGGSSTPTLGLPFSGSTNAFWIDVNDGDTGGLMIDNEGVTVYGAGDNGYVFRVIDEDVYQATSNVASSTTFQVSQGQNGGGFIKGNFDISGTLTASGYNKTNWDTAFGWGNHASAGYVPSARTITINGTSYDLSANRSWTVTASETDTLATVVARGDITNGGRPIRLDTSGGGVSIRGSAGGWATGYYFMGGTSNTYRGGFGALGENDGLTNYWIGPAYNNFYTYIDASQITHTSSMRAPIFYDSNNTGYYVDPASTSSLNVLSMANKIIVGSFPNSTVNNGEAWIGRAADRSAGTMTIQLGGNLDRKFEVVDYGWTTVNFSVNGYGAAEASGSMRAPIFYDSNDTSYYVDPASISRLGKRNYLGASSNWDSGSLNGANDTITNLHFQGHDDFWIGSGNTSWYTTPTSGHHDLLINTMQDSPGYNTRGITFTASMGGASVYRMGRWYSSTSSASSYLNVDGSVRTPILYDSNNTAYYVDPASTSNLNGLTVSSTITGSVSGSSGSVGGVSASQIVYGSGSSKVSSHSNANEWRNSGFYENDGGGSNWPSGTWYNSINVRHSNQGNYHGFQVAMSYYDNNLWFRSYQGAGTFQSWQKAAVSRGEGSNYVDYSRYVYNNGAYSGSGWVEPSDLGVRYALNSTNAGYATSSGSAGYLPTLYSGGQQLNPQTYFNNGIGLRVAMTAKVGYWSDTVWINGYSGGDVPWMCALHTQRNSSPRMYISAQQHTSSSYGTAYEFLTEYNYADYAVTKTTSQDITGVKYFVSNGNTSGSGYALEAYSNNGSGAVMSFHRGGYYAVNFGLDSDNVMRIGGWSASTNRWQLDMSGNMTAAGDITAYSDRRIKENIRTINRALDKVLSLRGVTYNRTDSEDKDEKIGVIAQEIQEVLPQVVHEQSDGMLGVSYGNITAVLIEAIKEQQIQIEELKKIVKQLTK